MRTFDRVTVTVTLVVIPLAVYFVGGEIIEQRYAPNGTYRPGTPTAVHDWWQGPLGYPMIAAVLAGVVAAVRVRRVEIVVGAAAGAGLLAWLYPIAAFLIFILLGGDPGWR